MSVFARRAPVWAWAGWILVLLGVVADLVLTIAHKNGVHQILAPSDVIQSVAFGLPALELAAIGVLVVSLRSEHRIGWLMLGSGLSLELFAFTGDYPVISILSPHRALPLRTVAIWLSIWDWAPVIWSFFLFLLLFPTGRLISGRWRSLLWIGSFTFLLAAVLNAVQLGRTGGGSFANPAGLIDESAGIYWLAFIFLPFFLVAALSLLRRLWVAQGVERQQLKWLTYAAGIELAATLLSIFGNGLSLLGAIFPLSLNAVPICMGIAIFRYRLYDIDVLINRTLVYGSLTAVLAGLYIGQVIALQALFRAVTGQASDLAIAVSTLVIAAVFNPLRHRIQDFIARIFYRRKYDAVQVLSAFGATCRDETDLGKLQAGLMRVVEETLQPAHVSLWLAASRQEGIHD